MIINDTAIDCKKPERKVNDPITDILQIGARKLLAAALESEIERFLSNYRELRDDNGRQRVVRNGYLPEREILTGIGPVEVKVPRSRDRQGVERDKIEFKSNIIPSYLRKTKSLEELIPCLYLRGISTGDFNEALEALLGKNAPGLSPATIGRLKADWEQELDKWKKSDLSSKRYIYFWVDGIYCNVRMEERQCLLVIMGATPDGTKELVALEDGYRESEQSWTEVLEDLKSRGLTVGPDLAVGDGALGFWKALMKAYPQTRCQRCWFHKTGNVLNKLPKGARNKAKKKLQAIYMAETKEAAEKQMDVFAKTYGAKYPKAVATLLKDRDVLLSFYDFPAEHWRHIRTTNPIESTFSTVRLRTDKVKSCFSNKTVITMAFQLCLSAQKRWQRLSGRDKLQKIVEGAKFVNGIEVVEESAI